MGTCLRQYRRHEWSSQAAGDLLDAKVEKLSKIMEDEQEDLEIKFKLLQQFLKWRYHKKTQAH